MFLKSIKSLSVVIIIFLLSSCSWYKAGESDIICKGKNPALKIYASYGGIDDPDGLYWVKIFIKKTDGIRVISSAEIVSNEKGLIIFPLSLSDASDFVDDSLFVNNDIKEYLFGYFLSSKNRLNGEFCLRANYKKLIDASMTEEYYGISLDTIDAVEEK